MTASQLISSLTQTVGEKYIITDPAKTEQYRQGYRFGEGRAIITRQPRRHLSSRPTIAPGKSKKKTFQAS